MRASLSYADDANGFLVDYAPEGAYYATWLELLSRYKYLDRRALVCPSGAQAPASTDLSLARFKDTYGIYRQINELALFYNARKANLGNAWVYNSSWTLGGLFVNKVRDPSNLPIHADCAFAANSATPGVGCWYFIGSQFSEASSSAGVYLVHGNKAGVAYLDGHVAASPKETLKESPVELHCFVGQNKLLVTLW